MFVHTWQMLDVVLAELTRQRKVRSKGGGGFKNLNRSISASISVYALVGVVMSRKGLNIVWKFGDGICVNQRRPDSVMRVGLVKGENKLYLLISKTQFSLVHTEQCRLFYADIDHDQ